MGIGWPSWTSFGYFRILAGFDYLIFAIARGMWNGRKMSIMSGGPVKGIAALCGLVDSF